jgi:hypothetical protein
MSEYYTPTRSRLAALVVRLLAWLYRGRATNGHVYYVSMPRWACWLARRAHRIAWPGVTTY